MTDTTLEEVRAACDATHSKCWVASEEFKRHPTRATKAALEVAMAEFKIACVALSMIVDEHD